MNINKLTNIVVDAVRSKKDKSNKSLLLAMAINGTYVEDATYDALEYCIVGITEPVSGSQEYTIISSGTGTMDQIVATSLNVNTSSYGTVECFVFMSESQYGKFVEPLSDSDWTIVLNPEKVEGEGEAWNMLSSVFNGTDYSVDNNKYSFFVYIPTTETPINFQYAGKPYQIVKQEQESSVIEPTVVPTFNSINYINGAAISSKYQLGDTIAIDGSNGGVPNMTPYIIFLTDEEYAKFSLSLQFADNIIPGSTQEEIAAVKQSAEEEYSPKLISSLSGLAVETPQDATYAFVSFSLIVAAIDTGELESATITYDGVDYVYDSTNTTVIE